MDSGDPLMPFMRLVEMTGMVEYDGGEVRGRETSEVIHSVPRRDFGQYLYGEDMLPTDGELRIPLKLCQNS